ncbi:MAG TPA: deoxyribose-phosphate aldolase [Lachnospiraceae bacterium]|nr:deoxyribose-phosphate aldolase [Lachnospiraceae bacterium]
MLNIEKFVDHTMLKPEATASDIKKLCAEAKKYGFRTVCINPCYVRLAAKELVGCDSDVCTVIGFPLGASHSDVKSFEAKKAVEDGANEVDMVINIGAVKANDMEYVTQDIRTVVDAVNGKAIVKVIIECCLLNDEEKILSCKAAMNAGASFVKTSTGFSSGGATISDVTLMKKVVGEKMSVKAAGGIRDYATAAEMIKAGADRIGASVGIEILAESKKLEFQNRNSI